jgi:16S rRNA (adenine1518-N6/adenine1519-N6)-dimethyltransferase
MLQAKFKCRNLLAVPPESFYPAPKVDSAIIELTPLPTATYGSVNSIKLNQIVLQAFSQRRKTLTNSLKGLFSSEQLLEAGINPQLRAENVSVLDYIKLSQLL